MLKKVLCVDDDQVTLILSKILLDKTSFCLETDEANNGQEAVKYFNHLPLKNNTCPPDLIFLDINMPVMNGWEFLDEFTSNHSANYPECKIVILLSNANNYDAEKANNYPSVIGFIQKPLSVASLEKLKSNKHLAKQFDLVASEQEK